MFWRRAMSFLSRLPPGHQAKREQRMGLQVPHLIYRITSLTSYRLQTKLPMASLEIGKYCTRLSDKVRRSFTS